MTDSSTPNPLEIFQQVPRHPDDNRFAYIDSATDFTPEDIAPLIRNRILLGAIFTQNSNVFPPYSEEGNHIRVACQDHTMFSFTSSNDTVGLEYGSAVITGNGCHKGFYIETLRNIEPQKHLSDYFSNTYTADLIRMGLLTEKGHRSDYGEYGYTIIHANPEHVEEGFFSTPHEHETQTNLKCNGGAGTVCLLADPRSGEIDKSHVIACPKDYDSRTYSLKAGDFMMMAKHVLHWTSPKIEEEGQHTVVTHNPMYLNFE